MKAATAQKADELELSPLDLEPRAAHPLSVVADRTGPARASNDDDFTPMELLRHAVAHGADLDRIERFMGMVREWKREAARDAFTQAMTDFKLNAPEIFKRRQANFGKTKGAGAEGASYAYADHADVVIPIAKGLAEHGFSHDWDIEQPGDGFVHVTCIVTHRLGHEKRVHMMASPDGTGSKNGIQSIGSTSTYLQRYTLLAATGLSTQSMPDDDGHGGGNDDGTPPAGVQRRPVHQTPPRERGERTFTEPPFDVESRDASASTAPADEAGCYPQAEFDEKKDGWISRVKEGQDPDRLIAFVQSRGKNFTEAQKKVLRAAKA